jgi:hypothetical protein
MQDASVIVDKIRVARAVLHGRMELIHKRRQRPAGAVYWLVTDDSDVMRVRLRKSLRLRLSDDGRTR